MPMSRGSSTNEGKKEKVNYGRSNNWTRSWRSFSASLGWWTPVFTFRCRWFLKPTTGWFSFHPANSNMIHGKTVVEKTTGYALCKFWRGYLLRVRNTGCRRRTIFDMHAPMKGKHHPENLKPLDFSITKNVAQLFLPLYWFCFLHQ